MLNNAFTVFVFSRQGTVQSYIIIVHYNLVYTTRLFLRKNQTQSLIVHIGNLFYEQKIQNDITRFGKPFVFKSRIKRRL